VARKYEADRLRREFMESDKPSKLWAQWGRVLGKDGWTWARFLSLLRICGAEVVWHMTGEADWEFFRQMIFGFTTGVVGEAILNEEVGE